MIDLKKKTAVVTGAARGIGATIAATMCELGARVAILDRDGGEAAARAKDLNDRGWSATAHTVDVREDGVVQAVCEAVTDQWGGVDILVNNAGIIRDNFIDKISEEDWDAVIDVNLKGAFLACKAVVPGMKERRYGKIVSIASKAWLGTIGQSNYSASKGGLVSLTRTLALELARYNINVNAVSPGLIDTDMTRDLPPGVLERLIETQPTRQMGTAQDVANAVCFLASDASRFITGQIIHVDGGKSCGLV